MDTATALKLCEATSAFYQAEAASFSATRSRPWGGWREVARLTTPAVTRACEERRPCHVLDVGCGNLRFERLLAKAFPGCAFEFHGVDNCPALLAAQDALGMPREEGGAQSSLTFCEMDVMAALADGALHAALEVSPCDLCVAFGFMHHIPMRAWREELLAEMVERATPGGLVAVTFWQFAQNDKMRRKAERTTAIGCAELGVKLDAHAGDYLLGWQDSSRIFRYCHSFSDAEVDALAACAHAEGARMLASFCADGPDGRSNRYLVLEKVR